MMYQRIRDLREDHDWNQWQVATLLHCAQQTYSGYELGQHDIPTETLIEIAELYHTSVDYILGLTDVKEPYPRKKK